MVVLTLSHDDIAKAIPIIYPPLAPSVLLIWVGAHHAYIRAYIVISRQIQFRAPLCN